MHKFHYLRILLLIVLILTGCRDQRILEEQGFIHSVGYDLLPKKEGKSERELLITAVVPKVNFENRKVESETLTTTSAISKAGRIRLSRQTELSLVNGQMRNVLFAASLAKKGLWPHMDTFQRDPTISQRLKITVVDGSAHDLLVKEYPSRSGTGQYIERMLEKQMREGMMPEITLYHFTREFYDDGIDPIAPIIKDQKDNVAITGIALFDEDRYVTKIPADQILIFAFLRGNFKQGEISFDFGKSVRKNQNNVMLTSLISKRNVKVLSNTSMNNFTVNIHVQIKASVLEYNGPLNLSEDHDRRKLEKLVSDRITDEANEVVSKMQKNNVDSIGLGKQVRNSMRYERWKKLNWDKVYPRLTVNCKVEMIIKDSGKSE